MPEALNPKLSLAPPPASRAARSPFPYAELDVTSNFSFLCGASHPDELIYQAAEAGCAAVAVTDVNSLAGVVRAHQAAKQAGIQLVVGTRLCFTDAPDVLAWPTDRAAYARLCRLLTLGKRRAAKGECALSLEDFLAYSDGILAAMVPRGGGSRPAAPLRALRQAMGGRVSLAVSCLYGRNDRGRLAKLLALARSTGVPPLATNHVHYHDPGRRMLQDVLTCIRHGCTAPQAGYKLFANGERYLKCPEQMHRLFADCPQALTRGLEIAGRCTFDLDELKYEYPDEVVPPGQSPLKHLAALTYAGAADRYPQGVPAKVRGQIEHELALIEQLQFEAYFLTVHDLVTFARSRGILCQGRGSAANSAVCYCLGVTSVDPARIEVLFERFISAARGEPPDIDIDFEHERREEVIQYVYDKYGRERAGMTAEVITYRGRSAVRDVGKALGLGPDLVDQMAKKLDGWSQGTLAEDQMRQLGLDPADRTVRLVVGLTGQLLGFPRHLSQHVGGMVMTRGPLCELVPIENASMADRTVIEWDKDDIDALGILKVDLLALGMLTCISKGLKLVSDRNPGAPPVQLHLVPPEDHATYDMVCDADTVGVFQIESRAQMSMLPRLRPRCFYDLVIEVAIVRPGPIQGDMVHPYLRRREGLEPIVYPSEALRGVLCRTLGVPLFQEQVMKVAMVGAGFSAGEADQLRRAMAAWKRNGKLEQFRPKFINGMIANGYAPDFAERCFTQVQGFGEYGFPESHAASFALLVYVSCWLKRHHPAAFACALLNSQPMGFYAPAQIVRDAREHGVEVRPVDVNASDWDCTLECPATSAPPATRDKRTWGVGGPALRLGFRRIKGLRVAHADRVVACRGQSGPFTSVAQFHRATGLPVHAVQRLATADAFLSLPQSRREATWQTLNLHDQQLPLFDEGPAATAQDEVAVELPTMPLGQEVMADYSSVGLSLKSHPVALVRADLAGRGITPADQLQRRYRGWVKVAGVVLVRQRPGTASGVVFITLEDETGVVNLIVRADVYERYRAAARGAALLQADGHIQRQGQVIHVIPQHLHDLGGLLAGYNFESRDFH